jgi:hypothetical protein
MFGYIKIKSKINACVVADIFIFVNAILLRQNIKHVKIH